jgi:hypothetical protein
VSIESFLPPIRDEKRKPSIFLASIYVRQSAIGVKIFTRMFLLNCEARARRVACESA